jgi:pyruvate,water dikinase
MIQTKRLWIPDLKKEEQNSAVIGGKGLHLFKLKSWQMPVPEFGIVSTHAFKDWQRKGVLDKKLLQDIKGSIKSWNCKYVAVRSSMSAEDGTGASYAGMMESFLYVEEPEIERRILEVFESALGNRVKAYEGKKNLEGEQLAAVVVQKMVASEISGVGFSRSPMGNSSLVYIEAGYGLGEGVVSGLVEVDAFWQDRFGNLIRQKIESKESQIQHSSNSPENTSRTLVPNELRHEPALSSNQLKRLNEKIQAIEFYLGTPADVEWAFEADKLYFLQVRPITANFEPLNYYIDTNLSESYPGLTSPFTGEFIQFAYMNSFSEALDSLFASKEQKEALRPYLENLVTQIQGHMYYDLNSYYAVLKALPKGVENIDNWHRMTGGKIHRFPDLLQKIDSVPSFQGIDLLRFGAGLTRLMLFHKSIYGRLCRDLENQIQTYKNNLKENDSILGAVQIFERAKSSLKGFGLTVLNDFLIMIALKNVTTLLEKAGYRENVLPSLIQTNEEVESLKPLHELQKLNSKISDKHRFFKIVDSLLEQRPKEFGSEFYEQIFNELANEGFGDLIRPIKAYLAKFGERSFEELKIECLTFQQSPSAFFSLLKWIENSDPTKEAAKSKEKENVNFSDFSLKDRFLLKKWIQFAHKTIAMREHTRLLRGQAYNVVRICALEALKQARSKDPAYFNSCSPSDFFSLSMTEFLGFKSHRNLETWKDIIEQKKHWRDQNFDYPEYLVHSTQDNAPYFIEEEQESVAPAHSDGVFNGQGAASGVVQGKALILSNPQEAMKVDRLDDKILITKTTDPAWVFILCRCAGLVSEKGSLLSHTAIIGRELNIPTVVGVKKATSQINQGEELELDGSTGLIRLMASTQKKSSMNLKNKNPQQSL